MKKVENLNLIADIIKSDELSSIRLEFSKKYSISQDSIVNSFNKNFGLWIKSEVDIRGFVDLVFKSNPSFNIDDFSLFDLIIEYLNIHLFPIKDLIDEDPNDVINVVLSLKEDYENNDRNLGSKEVTPELSDDVYNPFDEPELIIDEVINVLEVKFSNQEYRDRFYDVCSKFIKNVRNKIQTFEILVRAKKENGVGLNKNVVDEILNKIEKIKKQAEENILPYVSLGVQNVSPVQESQISDLNIGEEDKTSHSRLDAINNSNPIPENKSSIVMEYNEDGMKFNIFDGSIEEMYLNQIKNAGELSEHKSQKNIKLIGPIEELTFFTIRDFRNLDQDVFKRAERIEKKIRVLSSYSARKKVLGIKGWLSSEVCLVYKKMIDESVKYGDMDKVINLRKEKNDLYLTKDEIDAIAQLNRKLRI